MCSVWNSIRFGASCTRKGEGAVGVVSVDMPNVELCSFSNSARMHVHAQTLALVLFWSTK